MRQGINFALTVHTCLAAVLAEGYDIILGTHGTVVFARVLVFDNKLLEDARGCSVFVDCR